MQINDYLFVPYKERGRDIETGLDCWGLVRHVRANVFNRPGLPSLCGLDPFDKRTVTRTYRKIKEGFSSSLVEPGAIACAFILEVCVHVGVVVEADGRLWVMETDTPHGVSLARPRDFEKKYTRVEYWND